MNFKWQPDAADIERADATPWTGLSGWAFRPIRYWEAVRTSFTAAFLYAVSALVFGVWGAFIDGAGAEIFVLTAVAAVNAMIALGVTLLAAPGLYMRLFPFLATAMMVASGLLASALVIYGGEPRLAWTNYYIVALAFAVYLMRPVAAILLVASASTEFAIVDWLVLDLATDDKLALWFEVTAAIASQAATIGGITALLSRTAASEESARASLATLAHDLEEQVQTQVGEISRLGQLRRFLPPTVADAVLDSDSQLLTPHRRRIAVMFCDLRGFTAFTGSAEPEEVVGLLDEYFEASGAILRQHKATIGGYAGDGLMAFFGDPIETASPAAEAIEAAQELAASLGELATNWKRRGVEVSYGIGLAYGYATLGRIGHEDRYDYTALGTVVNLAARLCDKAEPGQILIDHATSLETPRLSSPVDGIKLKGLPEDTRIYALV